MPTPQNPNQSFLDSIPANRERSRFAAFDPARINENDLLAGALPLTALLDEDTRKQINAYFSLR